MRKRQEVSANMDSQFIPSMKINERCFDRTTPFCHPNKFLGILALSDEQDYYDRKM